MSCILEMTLQVLLLAWFERQGKGQSSGWVFSLSQSNRKDDKQTRLLVGGNQDFSVKI